MEAIVRSSPTPVEGDGYAWPAARPPVLDQLWMWLWIGSRSFGGGPAVQLMVYDALVTRRRWLSPSEYVRSWGMCQVVPGINLFSFAVLIGKRMGGIPGIACALFGMTVPGTLVIVLCTVVFGYIKTSPLTQAGLRGGVAGVAGMGLFMGLRLLLPQLRESAGESRFSLAASIGLFLGVALAFFFLRGVPIVLIFLLAGVVMAAIGRLRR